MGTEYSEFIQQLNLAEISTGYEKTPCIKWDISENGSYNTRM
jgi:hypothetical protein